MGGEVRHLLPFYLVRVRVRARVEGIGVKL